jgi:hypothetical protein
MFITTEHSNFQEQWKPFSFYLLACRDVNKKTSQLLIILSPSISAKSHFVSEVTQTVGLFLKWLFRYVATIRFGNNRQQKDEHSTLVNPAHMHVRENVSC